MSGESTAEILRKRNKANANRRAAKAKQAEAQPKVVEKVVHRRVEPAAQPVEKPYGAVWSDAEREQQERYLKESDALIEALPNEYKAKPGSVLEPVVNRERAIKYAKDPRGFENEYFQNKIDLRREKDEPWFYIGAFFFVVILLFLIVSFM